MNEAEVALMLCSCPDCGAREGESCSARLRAQKLAEGEHVAAEELARIQRALPTACHAGRLARAKEMVDSAVQYGLVERLTEDQVIEEALKENVRLGYMEACGTDEKGDTLYRLTPKGTKHVEDMIHEARPVQIGGRGRTPKHPRS